ncbi:MAG: extracellular solute-binding protein [Chloroflexota bacterium]|nr:extracellular solute-binding protein [Chloroflexota bacterium]
MRRINRRTFTGAVAGSTFALSGASAPFLRGAPAVLSQTGDNPALAPFLESSVDWRQAEGESIAILVTAAHYFEKFQAVTADLFTELTGVDVTFEVIPPKELREKAVLDLASGSGNYATHTGDPMYLPLYHAGDWIDPLDEYIADPSLTDAEWFDVDDIIPNWRAANTVEDKLYGIPVEGEATINVYRADVLEELGLEPPDTLEAFAQVAAEAHSPEIAGAALRGFLGAGQNMYIFPSLFLEFGGEWFAEDGQPTVNSEAGVTALQYYVDLLQSYAPAGVENWNWPEIMEAFAAGGVTQFIDANSTASVIENPASSSVAGMVGYQRWPAGPTGRRVSSIWNWAMPINKALSENQKKATWLYLQWLGSRPTQLLSATYKETEDAVVRTGVNRLSIWNDPEYRDVVSFTDDYVDVVLTSLEEDTDPNWRPRVPQWPEIGDAMAIAVQSALTDQQTPREALDEVNDLVAEVMGV